MNSRVIVVGVIKKDDKILFGRKHTDKGPYPNSWHIPGGGVNLGEESTDEAIRREIREEANIEITNIERIGFDEDSEPDKHGDLTHYIFLDFTADYLSGELTPGDDMGHLEWVEKSKIKDLSLNKPTRKLLEILGII